MTSGGGQREPFADTSEYRHGHRRTRLQIGPLQSALMDPFTLMRLALCVAPLPSGAVDGPLVDILPSENRVVGLLEWVQADLRADPAGEIDPAKCEIMLEGPQGRVSGSTTVAGRRLRFVPSGTQRIASDAPGAARGGAERVVSFEGTSIGAAVIQGPDGGAWDWRVDDGEATGRFDLYLPSTRVGQRRYAERTRPITGGLAPGAHRLSLTPTEAHPSAMTPEAAFWIHARLGGFVTSSLQPGVYTANFVARTRDGAERGRVTRRFRVDPQRVRDVRAYLESGHFGNVWVTGQDPMWRAVIQNGGSAPLKAGLEVAVRDFRGGSSLIAGPAVSVPPGAERTAALPWPEGPPGWYVCALRLTTAAGREVLAADPVTAALLPDPAGRVADTTPVEGVFDRGLNGALGEDPDRPLAFSYHLPDSHLSLYRKAGIAYVHGPIARTPALLQRARRQGIELGVADFGLSIREFESPEAADALATFGQRAGRDIKRFAPGSGFQFGHDEANTFHGASYQVWAAAQKVNHLTLKAIDPQSRVTAVQAGAWHDLDFFLGMAEQGAWPFIDFLNIHLYFPPERLRHALDLYAWMFRRLGAKPVTLGLWALSGKNHADPECAFPFGDAYMAQLRAQACDGFRQRVILRRYPWVTRTWHWNAYDYFECPHHSILFWDKTPKPLLAAVATLTLKLNGAGHVGALETGDDQVNVDVFEREGRAVLAVWASRPRPLNLDGVQGEVAVTDIMGATTRVTAAGRLTLNATPEPVLVQVPGDGLLKRARSDADHLRRATARRRRHAIVYKAGTGRGTRTETILPAGATLPLEMRILNAADEPLRGRMALARETRQGDWYGPTIRVLNGFQPFDIEPRGQVSLVFRVSAAEEAVTSNLTLRTLGYVRVGTREAFLDPTTVDVILLGRAEGRR